MFNEFQQEIIGAVAIVCILALYIILKRSSIPQTRSHKSEKDDIPKAAVQETTKAVEEIKEERDFEVITPALEETFQDSTSRRKSDKTIQKRPVPQHGIITKQDFSQFTGERILVAEDNHINQKVLAGLLGESGIELVIANDGQEALDILENDTNFLMILMDAHMPRVDGFQATRMIRSNPKYDHIVVVALSGDIASDDIQKMKDAGMSEQLAKPLRMESLYNIIYAYTGKETPKDELFTEGITTKNLDTDKGLQTCGGDENFYREILSEFITDYGSSSDKLGELLRSHDLQGASALLLDIIGIAANIGAHSLGEIASSMKLALNDTHEQSYFSLFDQYQVRLERLKQDIQEYL